MPAHSLESILAIPGNQAPYDRLKALLAKKSAIAFIGAGASAPIYPLWRRLIEMLAQEAVRRGLARIQERDYWLKLSMTSPLAVVSQIHRKIGDSFYHSFLYETFKDCFGSDGKGYTPAHGALMRANFKAYITTNYDPGILEARRDIRPNIRDTGFTVWNQNFDINKWASNDIFGNEPNCPILFSHGHFGDPENIVLDTDSYRRAYQNGPYRRLFQSLWHQQHLVFIGFGFSDVTLQQVADEVLDDTARKSGGGPRHVAIIGMSSEDEYTEEMRNFYLEAYHAETLFYPVDTDSHGHHDHSALPVVLESLTVELEPKNASTETSVQGAAKSCKVLPVVRVSKSATSKKPFELYIHETTDDEKFTGRANEIARLEAWAEDPNVRLIAITAIGGLGKTSLMGYWLRKGNAASMVDGVFFWSFYRDSEVQHLFESLCKFGQQGFGLNQQESKKDLYSKALEVLANHKCIVVLDGLEVVQEAPGTVAFGKLLQPELAEFLHTVCTGENDTLIVLTSRFPFPDLTPYLGGTLRPLPLPQLCPSDGAALLASFSVNGEVSDRERISENLGGHPLALRIFARSMPPGFGGDPTRLWQRLFKQDDLESEDSLEGKLRRLLTFYEERLPDAQRHALSLVALFRMPVGEDILGPLWEKLFKSETDRSSLRHTLNALHGEHLLTADTWPSEGALRYTCHPILRDHFRAQLLGKHGLARQAAGLLADQPDARQARTLDSVSVIVTAIEALLEAGEILAADDLYKNRLEEGTIFYRFFAPHVGLEVAKYFVRNDEYRERVQKELGASRLGFYLNSVGDFAKNAGEPETAYEFFSRSVDLYRTDYNHEELAIALGRQAEIQISLGNMRFLSFAYNHLKDAQDLKPNKKSQDLTYYGAYLPILQGDLPAAEALVSKADEQRRKGARVGIDVHAISMFVVPEYLLRIGKVDIAKEQTSLLRKFCVDRDAHGQAARCDLMLARICLSKEMWHEARKHLDQAKSKFMAGHMIYDLVHLLAAEAKVFLGLKKWDSAYSTIERAYQMAAPRRYRLIQADILNLRARFFLEKPSPNASRAHDDAEAALHLSTMCTYTWAERDSNENLAQAFMLLKRPKEAASHKQRAENLTFRLRPNPEFI